MASNGWLRLVVFLHVSAARAVAQSTFMEQRSYIEAYEAPRVSFMLRNYMREPGMLLELSLPAFAMEVIRNDTCATETEELREWLFTQTVAVSSRPEGSAITMLYAGMEDGRFIGCAFRCCRTPHAVFAVYAPAFVLLIPAARCTDYHDEGNLPTRYTFRAPGTSAITAAELQLGHICSDACPVRCNNDESCSGTVSTRYTLSDSCVGSSAAEACTLLAGCCDKDM